jgi:hypothetical protein
MGDGDVGCFNRSRSLTHLYLQCPSSDNDDMCCHPTCLTEYVSDHVINVSLFYQINFSMNVKLGLLH